MAKCATSQEAYRKRNELVALGLSADIIKIHPDNLASDDVDDAYAQQNYGGVKMLGGYIGSDALTLHQLQKHLAKLQQSTKNLIGLPNRQIRMLLLRLCFRPKIHFLLRTTRPNLTQELRNGFDVCKRQIIASLVFPDGYANADITDHVWDICRFGISEGGLGMDYLDDVRIAAYVASVVECQQTVSDFYPDYTDAMCSTETPSLYSSSFQDMVFRLHDVDSDISLASIFGTHFFFHVAVEVTSIKQNYFTHANDVGGHLLHGYDHSRLPTRSCSDLYTSPAVH